MDAATLREAASRREEIRSALLAAGKPLCLAEQIAAVSEQSFLLLRELEAATAGEVA